MNVVITDVYEVPFTHRISITRQGRFEALVLKLIRINIFVRDDIEARTDLT